jgi:hypothetical protein
MPSRYDKCFADSQRKASTRIGKAKRKGFISAIILGLGLYGTTGIVVFFMQHLPPSRLHITPSKKR